MSLARASAETLCGPDQIQATRRGSPPARSPRPAAPPESGIVFRAAVYGGSGYADGNLEILDALERQGLPLQLLPIGLHNDRGQLLPSRRRRQLEQMQTARFDLGRSVLYQCAPAIDFECGLEARVSIGRTTFETDTLPPGWAARCNRMDQVWVPSTFNRDTFAHAGVAGQRLRVMPEGLDTQRYRPGLAALPIPHRRGFNFLSIFDWIDRKGPDLLLRAFLDAFGPDDDVALILKVFKFDDPNHDLEERLLYFIERECGVPLEKAPQILLLRGLLPKDDMPRLYACADAFVLPSRGEGWGRPYMEAAASQLPVLATRWSGHLDFLHDENSYLIDIEGVVPAPVSTDREIYLGQGWAEPSVEHLSQLMRHVVKNRMEAKTKARRARREMIERWDTRVLAPRWGDAFRELLH